MAAPSQSSREKVLRIAQKMPASAQVLAQLGRLLMDVNSDLDDIAALLKRDAGLTARILRISNSAAFGGAKIGTVEEAVNRVGFTEVYRFCGMAAASQVLDADLKFYGVPKTTLRYNSLYTALAAEAIANRCGLDAQTAYSAGLMRQIGKVVLDTLAKDLGAAAKPFAESGETDFLTWEGKIFGMSNADVASMILREWKFPESVCEPVADQYFPIKASADTAGTALAVYVAASLAATDHALAGETSCWEINPAKLAPLQLTIEDLAVVADDAKRALAKVAEAVN